MARYSSLVLANPQQHRNRDDGGRLEINRDHAVHVAERPMINSANRSSGAYSRPVGSKTLLRSVPVWLTRGLRARFKCDRNRDRIFKSLGVLIVPQEQETRGRVVIAENNQFTEPQGFTTGDILWALGVWSVILTFSPVIVFYLLMVA